MRDVRWVGIALLLAAALAAARGALADEAHPSPPAARAAPAIPARYRDALIENQRRWMAGSSERFFGVMDSLIHDARDRGDAGSLAYLLAAEGQSLVLARRAAEGEPRLREAVELAAAASDTALQLAALRGLTFCLQSLDRREGVREAAARLLDLARAAQAAGAEAFAHDGLGFCALASGDFDAARRSYERALELVARSPDVRAELDARIGLGRAWTMLGDYPRARFELSEARRRAQETGDRWNEAHAWNNLGALELWVGDPSESVPAFERAREIHMASGSVAAALVPIGNLALAKTGLGELDDADSLARVALRLAERHGMRRERAIALNRMAGLDIARERHNAAAAHARAILAMGDTAEITARVDAMVKLARSLERRDSLTAAVASLESGRAALPALPAAQDVTIENLRGELLARSGAAADARRVLRASAALAERIGFRSGRTLALVQWGFALLASGERDSAAWAAKAALESWESDRGAVADPDWRSTRGRSAFAIASLAISVLFDPADSRAEADRTRETFDLLQRLKARTLHERMLGASAGVREDAGDRPGVTNARALQQDVLADDELLLDAHLGEHAGVLFAISRSGLSAHALPGAAALAGRIRLLRDLLAVRPGAGRMATALEAPARAVGDLLLAGAAGPIRGHRRLIFSGEGVLHLLPLGALIVGAGSEPLAQTHEISQVPSATLLARLRQGASRPGAGSDRSSGRFLALGGTRNERGELLPAVRTEIRSLERTFRGVDVQLDADSIGLVLDRMRSAAVIHVAGHTRADDQHPWRSGVLIGGAATRGDRYLRATDLARLRMRARLAVLSGCETAGGRVLDGEGVQGLAAALLIAGVPAVVATLWPVDDRIAGEFSGALYRALGRGSSIESAVSSAQRALRKGTPPGGAPGWAAFVLIGDGRNQVPLRALP